MLSALGWAQRCWREATRLEREDNKARKTSRTQTEVDPKPPRWNGGGDRLRPQRFTTVRFYVPLGWRLWSPHPQPRYSTRS